MKTKNKAESADGCNEFERVLLGDLELTQKYMQRVQPCRQRVIIKGCFEPPTGLQYSGNPSVTIIGP